MRDDNRVVRSVMNINNPQIAVAQPVESGPFSRHRFNTRHRVRISRQFPELVDQLRPDSRIQPFNVTAGPTVNHKLWHRNQNAESGLNAELLRRFKSRRAALKSPFPFSSRSKPSASLNSQNCAQEMMTSRGRPRSSTTIFFRIATMNQTLPASCERDNGDDSWR